MCDQYSLAFCEVYGIGLSEPVSRRPRWLLLSLLTALVLMTATGCENILPSIFAKTPEIYIPEGKCMEIREGSKIKGWCDGPDGKKIKCFFRSYPRCNVGVPTTPKPVPVKESEIK